jgi:hypothetical protein
MAMRSDPMSQPATVFIGPDMEGPPTTRRDTRHFPRLDDAIRYVVEKLTTAQKWGTYISADRDYRLDEIDVLYKTLPSSN